ncbi:hypothetical protein D3C85_550880 [compost metagenome]
MLADYGDPQFILLGDIFLELAAQFADGVKAIEHGVVDDGGAEAGADPVHVFDGFGGQAGCGHGFENDGAADGGAESAHVVGYVGNHGGGHAETHARGPRQLFTFPLGAAQGQRMAEPVAIETVQHAEDRLLRFQLGVGAFLRRQVGAEVGIVGRLAQPDGAHLLQIKPVAIGQAAQARTGAAVQQTLAQLVITGKGVEIDTEGGMAALGQDRGNQVGVQIAAMADNQYLFMHSGACGEGK